LFVDLFKWLDYIRIKKAKVDLFTNASMLTKTMGKKLLEYSDVINIIVFSFHGNNAEIYHKNMGLDFNYVKDNISVFMDSQKLIPCEIFMLAMHDQINDSLKSQYSELWSHCGFTNISIKKYVTWAGRIKIPNNRYKGSKKTPCVRLINQIDISCSGNVSMCCIDAFDEVIFGNVKESSLKSIIESDLRKQYIDLHNNGLSAQIPICSRCNINEDI
jgi:radical SAM protein with 4Fe4S-binding SPASM domain